MNNSKKGTPELSENGFFQQVLFKYVPFWYLFIILFVVFGTLAYLYIKTTPPTYESYMSILVKDEKKGQDDSKMEEAMNVFNTSKIVENELEILKSRDVVNDVVKKLKLYAHINTKTSLNGMVVRSGYLTSPLIIDAEKPDSLKETKKPIDLVISENAASISFMGKDYAVNEWIETKWGKIRFVKNPNYDPKALKFDKDEEVRYTFAIGGMKKEVEDLAERLVATPTSKQSSVIAMKIKDAVPARSEAILKNVVEEYNFRSKMKKNEVAAKTLEFIEERLTRVGAELDSVENSIEKFRNRSGVVDITEQSRLYLQGIEENDQKRNQLGVQISVLDDVEKYVTAKGDKGSLVPSTSFIADPTLDNLLVKLQESESEYEKLKKTTAENNPILSTIQSEIVKTRANVLENVRSHKNALETNKSSLDQISSKYSSLVNSIPQKERDLVDVSRQRNTKAGIYAFLLQKREETEYAINSTLSDSYIVAEASSTEKPVSPKVSLILIIACILPLIIGSLIISLKELINSKILYRSEIEELTKFSVLGEVIYEKHLDPLVTAKNDRSFIIEQFRQIRSSLKYLSINSTNIRRIVVSSSVEGEGKTFIASNLALSFARSGKKVVLLEGDLHQPRLCENFNLERGYGITDYLKGEIDIQDIMKPSLIHAGLSIISAGNFDQEASELYLNGKFEVLLNYLDKDFDLIVIDMAPINPISDLYAIAHMCDKTIYVVRHGKTPKVHLKRLDETMDSHNIDNLSIIFNGVRKRGVGKYSYGYGYGYGYDYKKSYDSYGKSSKTKVA